MWTISEEHMSVFAPTREAMEDVMERVNAILQEEEAEVRGGCSGEGEGRGEVGGNQAFVDYASIILRKIDASKQKELCGKNRLTFLIMWEK